MSFGPLVCHNFLKGREVELPCSYHSTCIIVRINYLDDSEFFFLIFIFVLLTTHMKTSAPIGAWK